MKTRIGINGFGRVGRLGFRAAWDKDDVEIVHVNELHGGSETAAHLLEFDTVHGRWDRDIVAENNSFEVAGKRVSYSNKAAPGEVDWASMGIDLVVESSGKFRTPELLQPYFDGGVTKVVVAAPVKEGALNVVMGCNDDLYDPAQHHLVTAASCTTNCIAPVVKVMHEKIGIGHGTGHDPPRCHQHPGHRRRAAQRSPACPIGTQLSHPDHHGFRDGDHDDLPGAEGEAQRCRGPRSDLERQPDRLRLRNEVRPVTIEEVNGLLKEASETYLKDILGYEERPLVSADYVNDQRSGIVDAALDDGERQHPD